MSDLEGTQLLHAVAERIVAGYLRQTGHVDVRASDEGSIRARADHVDLSYMTPSGRRTIKLKSDPYIGSDAAKASDRTRSFYRNDAKAYALETIAATRQPGWLFSSAADDLYYYYLAIDQTEAEVAELHRQPDPVLFATLRVMVDELYILPFAELREWFEPRQEAYPTRPVVQQGGASWYRLVPRSDVAAGVPGMRSVGSIAGVLQG